MTGYSRDTLKSAQTLRRELTDAEQGLWSILRNRQIAGVKFRRQQPLGPFIVDFVCQEKRLIIEADGGQHAELDTELRRTRFVEAKGYRVLRFWNNDILNDIDGVARTIATALSSPHPARAWRESPSPSRGEGNGALHG